MPELHGGGGGKRGGGAYNRGFCGQCRKLGRHKMAVMDVLVTQVII